LSTERIQKILAQNGYSSRRKVESLIKEGRVFVNDIPAKLGDKISSEDKVYVDGKVVNISDRTTELLMYNKPIGEECSHTSLKRTIFESLPKPKTGKWISIGRLDINTSGLLLITNDGKLANDIIHPSNEIEREYIARVRGKPSDSNLKKLMSGITIEKEKISFTDLVKGKETSSHTWFALVIMSGKNRSVRKLWDSIGHEVSRLKRVRLGKLFLPKELKEGKFKRISPDEVLG
jgi:23S rRNA pseudouridine2605 synthase|tara:strand:- start:232 stop:933 length:702 start_codon:yes stop_codon:yes gene_type:complete